MSQASCTLAGVSLQARQGEAHGWSLVAGVQPFVREFLVSASIADAIYARALKVTYPGAAGDNPRTTRPRGTPTWPRGPVELVLAGGPGEPVTIKGLYVIARGPGDDPLNTESLLVADARWLWRTRVVVTRYNVARPTAERRWLDGELTPPEVARTEADLAFERATLKDLARPWTAREVLEDVLAYVAGHGGARVGVTPLQDVVQGLELFDQGDAAVQRALALVPGILPWVDAEGIVRTLSLYDGTEVAAFTRAQQGLTPGVLSGSWGVPDRSLALPPAVQVGFEREHEVRFDYSETSSSATRVRQQPGREEPTLELVVPQPDVTLALSDGKAVAMGTYLRFYDEWLPAVSALADYPATVGALTQDVILRWFLAGMSQPHLVYSADVPGAASLLWSRRLSAVSQHWRQTFRLLPQWVDKIRSVEARRASIVSTETGARARSEAFCDYVVKPTFRGMAPKGQQELGRTVTGYAAQIKDCRPAPFLVDVVDPRVGLIRLTPRTDLVGLGEQVVPGSCSSFPSASAATNTALWHQVTLDAAWNLSVVLTVIPSVPNDTRRLWWETVTLADAVKALSGAGASADRVTRVRGKPGNSHKALGPVRYVLSGDTTARFAWRDEDATAIKESIWTGAPPPRDLLVNPTDVRDVAVAQAARVVAPLLPRGVGRVVVSLDKDALPTGNLLSVTHEVRGALATTTLQAPAPGADTPSVWSLLPERTRRIVARLVQE